MVTPSYLLPDHSLEHICSGGCGSAVKMNEATGRWFITMMHPGFNSPANNRTGYATFEAVTKALGRYASR